jgi:hypothetical protein
MTKLKKKQNFYKMNNNEKKLKEWGLQLKNKNRTIMHFT